ncbi:hypothetical protein [Leptothoe kymatousa]|uniref:Uncharacterized protein n=1 Tax=Leptothoe kymatousa TAU-MAC 1615 TaxID=2364775 RepID=A0ABS5Y0C8_9CYAN|nr:hypothetical protein [Leptothoe kymatousa]MBT9311250.1 hypothetical protein [Leptothoe kymatousa TAU-MAC 1615]
MQCQLIQNFINLPGIIGFSLTSVDQGEIPSDIYSVGFNQGRCPDQRPLLVQGIQQIIQTTPPALEFCVFQFGGYQVELHKAENGAILLIFGEGPRSSQHSKAVNELMHFIKADYAALIESIETLNAGNASGTIATDLEQLPTVPVDTVLAAMNSVSQVARRYLGAQLVVNHWRASQLRDSDWLGQFQIAADGTLSVTERHPELSPEQLAEVRVWIQRFHQRCTHIIRDYDILLAQTLSPSHWQLLFGE